MVTAEDVDKDPEEVLKSRKFIQSINEDGVFYTALYGSRLMIKKGTKGSIVMVSSIHGVAGRPKVVNQETGDVLIERFNLLQYTMGKHGVVGLSKALALQLADYGIRVNTVNPGYIMTPLFQAAVAADKNDLADKDSLTTEAFDFAQLAALHPLCNDPVKDKDIVPRGKFGGRKMCIRDRSMAQFNITLTEEELHGLFISNGRDVAVAKLLEKIFNEILRPTFRTFKAFTI